MFKRACAAILVFSLLLTGCTSNIKELFVKKEEAPVSDLAADALIFDGASAFTKTKELIASAKESIYIEQRTFADETLMNLIIEKAASGVEVRVLLDQFETANQATVKALKSENISAQYYPARKGQTNEVKFLLVDLDQALIYSFPWTADGFSSYNLAVLLTENSVYDLATKVFNRDWQFTTTLSLDLPDASALPEDNVLLARDANVKPQVIENISGSEKSIWAIVPYVTEQDTVNALIEAAGKGLDVRLIISSDIMPGNWPETLERLKAAGVQIRYFNDPAKRPLKMNVGIFDGGTFVSSSSGWGYTSFVMNHELSLTVPSPDATLKMINLFDQNWQNSTLEPQSANA